MTHNETTHTPGQIPVTEGHIVNIGDAYVPDSRTTRHFADVQTIRPVGRVGLIGNVVEGNDGVAGAHAGSALPGELADVHTHLAPGHPAANGRTDVKIARG